MHNIIVDFDPTYWRVRSRRFYKRRYTIGDIRPDNTIIAKRDIYELRSYDTIIGYHDTTSHRVYTWGYGRYSGTTSKQITLYCRENNAVRYDISQCTIDDFIKTFIKD